MREFHISLSAVSCLPVDSMSLDKEKCTSWDAYHNIQRRGQLVVWSAASNPNYPHRVAELSHCGFISPPANAFVVFANSTFKHLFFVVQISPKYNRIYICTAFDFKINIYMLDNAEKYAVSLGRGLKSSRCCSIFYIYWLCLYMYIHMHTWIWNQRISRSPIQQQQEKQIR